MTISIRLAGCLLILAMSFSVYATPLISAANVDIHGQIFLAVKDETTGLFPRLFKIDPDNFTPKEIKVPKELHRLEFRSIIVWHDRLIIFAQHTIESGAHPVLWLLNGKSVWKKLKQFDCLDFDQLKIKDNLFSLMCHREDPTGVKSSSLQSVNLNEKKNYNVSPELSIRFDQVEYGLPEKDLKIKLLGDLYEWQELEIESRGKRQKVLASQL